MHSVHIAFRRTFVTVAALAAVVLALMAAPADAATGASTRITADGAAAVATPGISAPADTIVGEANGTVELPVTLSAPGTETVTVDFATANSTAGASDCDYSNGWYVGTSGTLTFTPGQKTKDVPVTLNNCGDSGFLSFWFNLSGATNATILRTSTLVSIVGDPAPGSTPPDLYARGATADAGAGSVSVPVMLGGPEGATSANTVTVAYTTMNGTALSGTDYTATSGTLTFGPGQTEQNVNVPILVRSGSAPTRNFSVVLSKADNASIVQGAAVVTIGASGATSVASPLISAPPDTIVGEADGYVDLPVTLSAPGTKAVTVDFATANGTGNDDGCDYADSAYVATSGTLTFAPGETLETVRVQLLDCGFTGPLTFTFNLSGADNSTIARATTTVTVVETPASIKSFSPASGPSGTVVTINGAELTKATSVTIGSVAATITSDTAKKIVISVPTGATTGLITVVTPNGTAVSSKAFTVS